MRNLIKTFLLILMLSFSHAAIAGDLEDGYTAINNGDAATALKLWTPLAERGDVNAQSMLGLMYSDGWGVAQDYEAAVKWTTLAAEQGDDQAQFNLGQMYREGRGVEQNHKIAFKWYALAAERGTDVAHSALGVSYANGQGVAQDYVKAHMWFNIAAIDGLAAAIKNRDYVAKKMTPAQIAEAHRAASKCIKQNFKNCD